MTAAVASLTFDLSGVRAGAAEYETLMARVTRSRERQAARDQQIADQSKRTDPAAAYGPATQRVDQYTRALDRLQAKSDPVFRAQLQAERELSTAYKITNEALARGVGNREQHLRLLDAERARTEALVRTAREAQQAQLRGGASGASADNRGIEATSTSFMGLTTRAIAAAAAVVGFGYTIKSAGESIARAGDDVRTATARLNVLTGAATDLKTAFTLVFGVAQRMGIALNDAGDAFGRIAIAATDMGATSDQIAKVTQTILQLGRIGGATQQQLVAGTTQLAQALSSGVLQGDELRSVKENIPLIAKAVADAMGVSVGQLKKLAEEGKITSSVVMGAMVKASGEADAAFKKLPVTVEQASAKSSNAWKLFGAELDQTLGISRLLSSALSATAERVEDLARRMSGDIVLAIRDVRAEAARLEAEANKGKAPVGTPVTAGKPTAFGPGRVRSYEEMQAERNAARAAGLRQNADEMERWNRRLTDEAGLIESDAAAKRARAKLTSDTGTLLRDIGDKADPARKALREFTEEKNKLDKALKAGVIDQRTFNQGMLDAHLVLSRAGQGAKDTAEAIRALADVAAEADFAKRLSASAYAGAAALGAIEDQAKAADKALQIFGGKRNPAFEQRFSAELQAKRQAGVEQEFKTTTLGLERENSLLTAQLGLIGQRPEIVSHEINLLKVKADIEAKGSKVSQEDIDRRVRGLDLQDELNRKIEETRQQQENFAQPFKTAISSLESFITGGLVNGFANARQAILGIWRQMMAEIAVQSVVKPLLLQPVVQLLGAGGLVPGSVAQQYGGGILGGGVGVSSGTGGGLTIPGLGGGDLFGLGGFMSRNIWGGANPLFGGIGGLDPSGVAFGAGAGVGSIGGVLGGLGGIGAGIFGLASGNMAGGIAGLLGGGLGLAGGLGLLGSWAGPAGMAISLIGGLLGGLLKKKAPTPQGVSNLMFTDGAWSSSLAMTRGKGGGAFGTETTKLAGTIGKALDDVAMAYDLTYLAGTPGGYIGHSQGKNTGSMYFGGIGRYGGSRGVGFGAEEIITGQSSPEAVVNAVAAEIIKRGVNANTIAGLTGTQTTALRTADLASLDDVKKALDFSKVFDTYARGRTEITQAQQAMDALKEEFKQVSAGARQYGLDLGIINQRYEENRRKVATDFNDMTRRGLLSVNNPDALAREDLTKAQEARRKEADYLNSLFPGLINFADLISLNNLELTELEKTLGHANDNIRSAIDRLNYGGDVTNLTLRQQYDTARGEFFDLGRRSLAGDATVDRDRTVSIGDTFTQLSRQLFSISGQNAADIASARGLYEWLIDPTRARPPGFASGGIAGPGEFIAGEHGPERIRTFLPAQVLSRGDTMNVVGGNRETLEVLRKIEARLASLERRTDAQTGVVVEGVKATRKLSNDAQGIHLEARRRNDSRRMGVTG